MKDDTINISAPYNTHLWQEFLQGNESAFETIYREHAKPLMQYGRIFTTDNDLLHDCIHDLFVEIYNKRNNLGPTNNIRFYLITSLKHKLIKAKNSSNKFSTLKDTLNMQDDFSLVMKIEKNESANLMSKILLSSSAQLSSREREAVYLRFTQELSYEEISKLMAINYQSVRNLIYKAIQKLKNIMSKHAKYY